MTIEDRVGCLSPHKQALLLETLRAAAAADTRAQTELVAFIAASAETDLEAIERSLASRLPQYMLPKRLIRLDALPKTPNGKIDRAALEDLARSRIELQAPSVAGQMQKLDEYEQRIRVIWIELLGHERVGLNDDFFTLGGHSLLAIRMLARIRAAFDCDIPVALVVEMPTIARLAAYVRTAKQAVNQPSASIAVLQREGSLPPLYLLPLHMHGPLHYRHLVAHLAAQRPILGFAGFDLQHVGVGMETVETLASKYTEQLLQTQPHGPYYLCGISVAGLLAFEMGRILHARGIDEVEIILLDTYGPGYPQRLGPIGTVRQMFQRLTERDAGYSLTAALTDVIDSGWTALQKTRSVWTRRQARRTSIRRRGAVATAEAPAESALAALDIDFINQRLSWMTHDYLTHDHPFAGKIHLVNARLKAWSHRRERRLGWQHFVTGEIAVYAARGDHLGILTRRFAPFAAECLSSILGACDARYGSNRTHASLRGGD